ncbi:T9SS type B sorting domain-containing protein [Sinomicrobium oceani]|uniref:T9SS type B sorting domain-containing protein n=1 Tax=Sinomicrobium oceani TaxID=1150368 RepID=UPI00227A2A1A|nr:gliding motility-associated C-terminal domain-containing protein [Sinomicrobium oceani]
MKIGSFVFIFLCCWCNVNAQETSDIVVVLPGSKVTLNAASEGAVSYQWFLDGEELSGAVGATYIAMQQGKYTVISRNDEGCDSTISNTVEIRFSGRSSPPSGAGEQYFCHFNDPVIADIEVIGAHITWYDEEEGGSILAETTLLEDGSTYYATQAPEGPASESEERLAVTVFLNLCPDLSVSKSVDNQDALIGTPVIFSVKVSNETSLEVRNIAIRDHLPSGFSYTSHTTDNGNYNISSGIWDIPMLSGYANAELQVHAEVLPEGDYTNRAVLDDSDPWDVNSENNFAEVTLIPSCARVYNLFSPNGDGINDVFRIDCIEKYPDNTLEVFNRYGNTVFRQKGYDNTWQGESNVKNTISRNGQLPAGTYYYVLSLGNGTRPVTGWLFIMR